MKLILAFATLLVLSFQNCSGKGILNAGFFSGKANPGNGSGYEGISNGASGQIQVGLFLSYLEDGTCTSGGAKSSIVYTDSKYYIERLDCENISPPQQLNASQIVIDTENPLVLYYGGRTFRQR